jgi:hypothetical protein
MSEDAHRKERCKDPSLGALQVQRGMSGRENAVQSEGRRTGEHGTPEPSETLKK